MTTFCFIIFLEHQIQTAHIECYHGLQLYTAEFRERVTPVEEEPSVDADTNEAFAVGRASWTRTNRALRHMTTMSAAMPMVCIIWRISAA
ncbi:hypothetical protein Q1M63_28665 [Sinorhizobium meliloti]|nr:hypothetical protein Q1M63_28665 [Sinorhizobium meliloti]